MASLSPLSSREREVLQLIAEGRSVKQIAGLTKYAIRQGLTSTDDEPRG